MQLLMAALFGILGILLADPLLATLKVVLVDLSDTDFMDSTGIAELAIACKHQRELGGDLILDAPNRAVSKVIEISGLDRVMTVTSGPERPSPSESR